jgi:hypothetical protein
MLIAYAMASTLLTASAAQAAANEMSYYCSAESGTSVAYVSKVFTGPWGQTQQMQVRWKEWLESTNRRFDFSSLNCRGFEGADAYSRNRPAADAAYALSVRYRDMGYAVHTELGAYEW